jgi:putative ABC transport system permease protein
MKNYHPPRAASWLLSRLAGPSVVGDYEEIFEEMVLEQGPKAALSWYRTQVLKSIPMFVNNTIHWSAAMLKNYLKLACRNIFKHKRYALLNIAGLAVGLAACLLMAGYVVHELSYETMHPRRDRIFRINGRVPMGGNVLLNGVVCAPFGPAAEESVPEIEESVRILRRHNVPVRVEDRDFKEEKMFFGEQSMLDVFALSLIRGNPEKALKSPFTVVIDEELAEKYFGGGTPIGKAISLTLGKTYDFQVTGIMKKMPSNTVLRTPMIASFPTLRQTYGDRFEQWVSWGNITTFVRLRQGVDPAPVDEKLTALARQHLDEDERDASYYLQPLGSIYINRASGANINNDLDNTGSISRLYIFSAVAILILIIAAINFINLSTAKISGRMKEVGIRKTCGAQRSHLLTQFLVESVLITTIAMGLGLALFSLFKPRLDLYLGKTLNLGVLSGPWILPFVAGLILAVGFLAGSYPAFFLSRFQAAVIFRSGVPRGASRSGLRKILVGTQFFIAAALIACTLIVLKQVKYSETKDLGFNHENLIVLNNRGAASLENPSLVKEQILNRSGALAVSSVGRFPSAQNRNVSTIRLEGQTEEEGTIVQSLYVDEDFVPLLELKISAGRNFARDRAADTGAVLLNETAAAALGLEDPIDSFLFRGEKSFRVIGVLEDWNTNSIHSRIYPMVLFHADGSAGELVVRIPSGKNSEVVAALRGIMSAFFPQQIFDYAYVEDLHFQSYAKERRLASLLVSFCQLAIFVACLGIFGLSAYSAEQRTKEIGIRKILGATIGGIVYLFSGSYVRWVVFANILAWPAAYLIVNKWLRAFAFRTSIGVLPFLTAGLLTMGVALLSVVFQTTKAALANPARSLRYE